MGILIIIIFWIGLFPQTIFNTVKPPVSILTTQIGFLQNEGNHQAINLNKKTNYTTENKTIKPFPDYTFNYVEMTKTAK